VVYVMAGWARMRLITFLLLDLAGALLLTGLVAGLGYGLGQRAVDFVLLVDKYASTVSLTMIAVTLAIPPLKRRIRQTSSRGATAPGSDATNGRDRVRRRRPSRRTARTPDRR
jgi:membrane protein DedA with SNARE-associated domain